MRQLPCSIHQRPNTRKLWRSNWRGELLAAYAAAGQPLSTMPGSRRAGARARRRGQAAAVLVLRERGGYRGEVRGPWELAPSLPRQRKETYLGMESASSRKGYEISSVRWTYLTEISDQEYTIVHQRPALQHRRREGLVLQSDFQASPLLWTHAG